MSDYIAPKDFQKAEGVEDWRLTSEGACALFRTEQMDEPRGDGGGAIHLAIWVPGEHAEARVAAALAAGGRMVRDEFAPSWWTLADAYGNEADIATVGGRD
jgi:4a-hydroxytetrahydrobiopterin dehydratase